MSEAKIFYQDDCNLAALDGKTIADEFEYPCWN